MDFTYSPLASSQLRLLRPVNIIKGVSIALEISHFERHNAPPYTAISYTWGDEDETNMLLLNKRQFPVRRNLWSCLNYLGLNSQHSIPNYLWVDAICIDQTNISERNAQVQVMDKIYKNAHHVSVWLGFHPRPEDHKDGINWPSRTFDIDSLDWLQNVKKLADHEYWSRYWVIQECLLAHNIQLHFGTQVIDWEMFRDAVSKETRVNLFTDPGDRRTTATLDARKHGALPLLLARQPWDSMQLRPLNELIIHHRHSICKDPRDRVFALLGLLPLEERSSLERFFPNYSLSHDRVVVIALAHMELMNGIRVTANSQDLFQGLGVESKERQTGLLFASIQFNFMGYDGVPSDASREEFARSMAIDEFELDLSIRFSEKEPERISSCNIL
ncbi:hypothetical protein F4859DRAFT_223151 [Xylaria cf. heliscus]|nr:hypothetical protein F4859DRAFT_223151 [Xylaria cf. heliscus]